MTDHTLGHDHPGFEAGAAEPGLMDTDIRLEIANEMRALAAAMFGLRFQEEVSEPSAPAASPGPGDVDVLGGSIADFDFDHELGHAQDDQPDEQEGAEHVAGHGAEHGAGDPTPPAAEPSRWATHDEPTMHNARTRAMLEEIAFLDE